MKTPEGYVLAPVEPTGEMIEAGVEYWHKTEALLDDIVRGLFKAMLSAAPRGKALVEEGPRWKDLSPDEQFALAERIAANVGYVLTPEPEHPDGPHARAALVEEGGLRETEEDDPLLIAVQRLRPLSALSTKDMAVSEPDKACGVARNDARPEATEANNG